MSIISGKYNWKEGKVSGAIYHYDEELIDLVAEVCKVTSYANPLHPDIFPGVCKMEAEVIKMVAGLFHGGEDGCGVVNKFISIEKYANGTSLKLSYFR